MADSEEAPGEGGAHESAAQKIMGGKNKKDRNERLIVLATLAGVVISFMILRKTSGGGSSGASSSTAGTQMSTGQLGYAGGGSVAGQSADASALQGLNSNLANQSALLQELITNGHTATASAGNPPESLSSPNVIYGQAAAGLKYLQDATAGSPANGAVFQVQNDGTMIHLSPAQYAALGTPDLTAFKDWGQPPNLDYVNSGNPGPLQAAK